MIGAPFLHRIVPLLAAAAALPAVAAASAPSKLECVAAHEQAQVTRKRGQLVESKQHLLVCAQSSCPEEAQLPCLRWLREVEAAVPTVVVGAVDPGGRATLDVRVLVDGAVAAERLEGRAIEVNPGLRRFRFEISGAPPIERSIAVLEGEKARALAVAFERTSERGVVGAPPVAAPDGSRPVPAGVLVLGGIGLAGLAAFGVLGATGLSSEQALRESGCAPDCDTGALSRQYLGADIALGVGVVSLAVAAVLFVTRPTVGPATATATRGALRIEIPGPSSYRAPPGAALRASF